MEADWRDFRGGKEDERLSAVIDTQVRANIYALKPREQLVRRALFMRWLQGGEE
jgi:hypothetical protein